MNDVVTCPCGGILMITAVLENGQVMFSCERVCRDPLDNKCENRGFVSNGQVYHNSQTFDRIFKRDEDHVKATVM